MKKILLLCSILLIIASCNNSEQVVEIEELEKEYIEKLNRAEDFGESQISQLSAHVNKLEKENTELKNEVHELEFYKHLNFQEMKLVHEYLNPDNSEKNIYVYTNSYNSSQVNNIKEVENCASIRHRDNDAYDCFIFIGNNDYKKLLFQSDFPIKTAFEKKNTFTIYSYFSGDGGGANSTTTINIDTGLMKRKTNITAPTENIEQITSETNIYECFDKNPMFIRNFYKCFKN